MHKSVLITGAYGMLASYMVYMLIYLNEEKVLDIQIFALGRNADKFNERFGEYLQRPYFHIVNKSVCEPFELENEKIDFIIHAASPASSHFFGTDPVGVANTNIIGTFNMLEMARKYNAESFLFFSSGAVYGDLEKEFIDESDTGRVYQMDVRSCYAESKRAAENLSKCYSYQYNVPVKIVRPSHTYGPTTDIENDSRVFAEFTSDIVNKRNMTIKSDGGATRVFCYIADATEAYFKILLDGLNGEAYNVSSDKGLISIRELAYILVGLYPKLQLNVIFDENNHRAGYLEDKKKFHPQYSTKKLEALGWTSKYTIEEGFKRTIDSFKEANF